MRSQNKVFVGPGNIAGSARYLSKALRLIGVDATSYSYNAHPFGYPCDYEDILIHNYSPESWVGKFFLKPFINKYTLRIIWTIQKLILFNYAIITYDTFIFISNETFFRNNIDLKILRVFKKKIAFIFVGCPERDPEDNINQTDRGFCSFCNDFDKQKYLNCINRNIKKAKIEFISRYANVIFSHRDTTSFITDKSKIRKVYISTDLQINGSAIPKKFKGNEVFITHIPSNALLKGTELVRKVIKDLAKDGFDFHFFSEPIAHKEVENLLKHTHILIDQFSPVHGLLSVEGMANGCVVICRTAKWFREDFPALPLVSCEPDELKDVLINLISNRVKMENIAQKSFEYFKMHHSQEAIGNYYKKELNLF